MRYRLFNGPMQTTASFLKVATGTSIKTMLQAKPLMDCKVIAWGFSTDGSAAATPGTVELIETGTVAATVTASVAADITLDDLEALRLNSPSTHLSLGTSATGYTATVEGSVTAVRNLDTNLIAPTTQYAYQWPLGREPAVQANNLLRVRVDYAAAISIITYVVLEF